MSTKKWFEEQQKEYENDINYWKDYCKILQDELTLATQTVEKPSSCAGVSLGDSQPVPEQNQQNGGWVSVKDKLPVDDKQYLVYTIFLDMKVRHFNFDEMVWDDEYGDDYYCDAIGGKVTHWQPLPKPPLK